MFLLSLDDVKPGMILAQNVFSSTRAKLVNKDTILDSKLIERLRSSGVAKILIDDGNGSLVGIIPHMVYDELVEFLNDIRLQVLTEASFDMNQVIKLVTKLTENIKYNSRPFTEMILSNKTAATLPQHLADVCFVAIVAAKEMGCTYSTIRDVGVAALLHDIGKYLVPEKLLTKVDLTADEQFLVMKHTTLGHDLLSTINGVNKTVQTIVAQHHERVDGSGYPYGLTGGMIDKLARLVGIADLLVNLVREQPNGLVLARHEAAEYILAQVGYSLDQSDVDIFINTILAYPLQCHVRLSTGQIARVVHLNNRVPMRPVVKVGHETIDLAQNHTVFIDELVQLMNKDSDQYV